MKLELTNIEKSFGEKEVLKGISFFAVSGEAFGLWGATAPERLPQSVF